jgi:hypothetical protein
MMDRIKDWLSGRKPREVTEEREREITSLRHEVKNSIQAVQSGQRILQTMSGVIELDKRNPLQ